MAEIRVNDNESIESALRRFKRKVAEPIGLIGPRLQRDLARMRFDSISAGLPRDRIKALAAVTETDGAYMSVTDDEILEAIPALARGSGVFAEPAGATAYVGLVKAVNQGLVSADERVVVLNTGNGLKDVASAMKSVELVGTQPYSVAPNMDNLKQVMDSWTQ